jgi:alginate O-acetyltransferase complex protein AlgI
MLFTSPQFILFFVLVVGGHFFMPLRFRRHWLLIASLFFISTFGILSLLFLLFFSGFNFLVGLALQKKQNKGLYYFALCLNVAAIIFGNYLLSFHNKLYFALSGVEFGANLFLAIIGISFYNLQHLAYIIDVKNRRIIAERNLLDFLLFSLYFPKFLSGPITLYQQLKQQSWQTRAAKNQMFQGFNRILLGFLKKLVLADRLWPSVHSIFDFNDQLPGLTILAGALLFTIQLYFDFSGYCDIAIGVSKMLGIELPENFDFPFRADSITTFWRRWHKTLIGFFTTYVFYPLSFRYRKLKKHAVTIAILATLFVSAIWHGLGITFLLWALCHVIYLLTELYLKRNSRQNENLIKKIFGVFVVILLVSFSHLFFRATSTENCLHLFKQLTANNFFPRDLQVDFIAPMAVGGHQADLFNFFTTLFFVALTLLFERKIFNTFSAQYFKPGLTFLVLLLIFVFGVFNNGQRFIYMQF